MVNVVGIGNIIDGKVVDAIKPGSDAYFLLDIHWEINWGYKLPRLPRLPAALKITTTKPSGNLTMPVINHSYPTIPVSSITGVQPMGTPTAIMHYIKHRYARTQPNAIFDGDRTITLLDGYLDELRVDRRARVTLQGLEMVKKTIAEYIGASR